MPLGACEGAGCVSVHAHMRVKENRLWISVHPQVCANLGVHGALLGRAAQVLTDTAPPPRSRYQGRGGRRAAWLCSERGEERSAGLASAGRGA